MSKNNIDSIIALFTSEKFQDALNAIEKLIVKDQNDALLFNIRGACFAGINEINLAKENYEKAIAINPEYSKAHFNLAGVFHELKDFNASIRSYQKALIIEPNYAEAHNNLGNVLRDSSEIESAIESYKKAIFIKQDYVEAHYSLGTSFQELGKLKETVKCYKKVLELRPNLTGTINNLGNILRELGRSKEAISQYKKAIEIDPDFVEVYFNLGTTFQELDMLDKAVKFYKKAIEINSDYAEAHNNLGVAYKDLKDFDSAIQAYQKAIKINPEYAEAHNNIGILFRELGQLDLAIKSHETALKIIPEYAEAQNNLGIILIENKELYKAIERFEKSIAADTNFIEAYNNLGSAYMELNNFDSSLNNFQKALIINPDYVEAHNNLGSLYMHLGQLDEAVECFKKSIKINPNFEYAHNNLGLAYHDLDNLDEAAKSFKKAMSLNPSYFDPCANYGNLLTDLKKLDESLKHYELAYKLNPDADFLLGNIVHTKMHLCIWDNFSNQLVELKNKINDGRKEIGPFALMALIDDPEIQKKTSLIYAQDKFPKSNLLPKIENYPKHKKIRIGYFSFDFREHPVTTLTAELYEVHDRSQFEVYAFSYGPDTKDEMNLRIKSGVDHFYDVQKMPHKDLVLLVRSLEIDIAIDLGGFTASAITSIFAMSVAPIQLSYIGFLGTMGANYYDYLISDLTIIPESSQKHYSEKIIYLPNFQANDSKQSFSVTSFSRKDLGLPEKGFVFSCFNNTYKLTPSAFDSWGRILKSVEGSVLLVFASNKTAEKNLTKEINRRGIASERLVFGNRLSRAEYLGRYKVVDLFLDTNPYNAGTTSSDALRMGLPVITYLGQSFPSRMGASILKSINMPELIANSQNEYESMAIELAKNPKKLIEIKEKLAINIKTAPLFNSQLFTKHLESAYRIIYDRHNNGLKPDHVFVDDSR